MITQQDIRRITNLPEDKMVLMAVVNTNPASTDNQGGALLTRIKSHAKDEALPPTLLERLLGHLQADRNEFGKSEIYILGEDLDERIGVNLDLPERLHYGRPLRSVLMDVQDAHPRLAVLALDREWARFFILEQGELSELRKERNPEIDSSGNSDAEMTGRRGVPGASSLTSAEGAQSSSGNDFYQNHQDAITQRFFNEIATQLETVMREHDLKFLALVGPEERRAEFRAEIPSSVRFEVVAETNTEVSPGFASQKSLMDKLLPMVENLRTTVQERLMSEVQEKGIMDVENVLEAIQQGRVYALVIPSDGSQMHIFASTNPEVPYFTAKKNETESPLDGSPLGRITLEDALPALSDLYGLEIHRMKGEHTEKLVREFGGLAGLVRY